MVKFDTPLCELAFKYGSDKCPQIKYHFTEFYFEIFKDKTEKMNKVVEIGVQNGASLFMWRDFFPQAQIYGADIDETSLFKTDRIETFLCDQTKNNDLQNLINRVGSDIDLFIDDGSHNPGIQVFTCLTAMPLLSKDTLYVIENVRNKEIAIKLNHYYDCEFKRRSKLSSPDDRLLLVRHRKATDNFIENFDSPLCKLAFNYGSDKCPQIMHHYTPFYFNLFKNKKDQFKKVLEIGIGDPREMAWTGLSGYKTGASLHMWQDFFPDAQIYGVDIEPRMMFKTDRIETFLCDQSNEEDLKKLLEKTGTDIDLVIDDGSHKPDHQVITAQTLMPLLKKDVIYIIEDVAYPEIADKLDKYVCEIPPLVSRARKDDRLMVVRNKNV